ncbi:MAG: FAD-binding protein [Geminicoccaceae bacterium]
MHWQPVELAGWGRTARARVLACGPRDAAAATAALAEANGATILPYGGGRSYGDVALNGDGRALLTGGLNRILEFDAATGRVVCEAGVTFRDLLEAYLPRRHLVPVSPGTAFATLGGAVANDVHGKNHEVAGSFGDHVLWLDLALPSGEVRRVCPQSDPELFAATIGGIGLSGLILRVCFRLEAVPSASVEVEERRMTDLDAFMAAFAGCRATSTFSVGWIDAMARGRHMGRGILETGELAVADAAPFRSARQRNVPFDFPAGVLNPLAIRLFNELYYRRVSAAGRRRTVPIQKFLYPLDALGHWNRIYGRRGFYQFQCVIPDRTAAAGITALLETMSRARRGSFLAVLKTLGQGGRGHLSFPERGYTLAMDFPRAAPVPALLRELERITLEHGGRVYLAKDAALSAVGFGAMYPRLHAFRDVLGRVDPNRRLASDMARRLRIRD